MKCAIIQDLLPLYCDEALSPESAAEVQKHLEHCDACRKVYDDMCTACPNLLQAMPELRPLKKLRRRIKRTYIVMGIITVLLLIANSLVNIWVDPPRTKMKQISYEVQAFPTTMNTYTWENAGGDRFSARFPKDAELTFDEQSNYVYCNGEKLTGVRHGAYKAPVKAEQDLTNPDSITTNYIYDLPDEEIPAEVGGWVSAGGEMLIRVNVKTHYPYERVEHYGLGNGEPNPVHATLSVRPTFITKMNIGGQGTDYPIDMLYRAYECGEGATMTILCSDGEIVLDLHQLAVENGLLDE